MKVEGGVKKAAGDTRQEDNRSWLPITPSCVRLRYGTTVFLFLDSYLQFVLFYGTLNSAGS